MQLLAILSHATLIDAMNCIGSVFVQAAALHRANVCHNNGISEKLSVQTIGLFKQGAYNFRQDI